MIPSGDKLAQIASLRHGDLVQIPFPVLLVALFRARLSTVLELVRKPVEKRVMVVDGVPVDCRSNLVHETFGRFLVGQGKLSEEDFGSALAESLGRELPIGEVLLERRLIDPEELSRRLQQSLARKLLDGFTWRQGTFRLSGEAPAGKSELRVNVPQLILTGILKLSPLEEVTAAIRPICAEPLAWNPEAPEGDLQPRGGAARVLEALRQRPLRLDELAGLAQTPANDLGRIVYALLLLEAIVPATRLATAGAARALQKAALDTRPLRLPGATDPQPSDLETWHRTIREEYLSLRRKDAFELLGVPEEASHPAIDEAFLAFCRQVAPWRVESAGGAELADKARTLFLAAAEAYGELRDNERRGALIFRRKLARQERARSSAGHRIQTDLLDPEVQYRKGQELFRQGQYPRALELLQYAADLDAQNAAYRADAAFCRYMSSPGDHRQRAQDELAEALRVDPTCGIAYYYLGLILGDADQREAAEEQLRRAIRLMAPDRRPIEALRELTARRGRG
jgi:tetratricopeptide (TPR) repeat protein